MFIIQVAINPADQNPTIFVANSEAIVSVSIACFMS